MRLRLTLTLTLPMMISATAGLWEGSAPSQDSKPVSATLAHESDKAHIARAARPSRARAWAWRAPNDPQCTQ